MMIHNSAIISPSAFIGNNVKIGPFCIVGDKVEIGDDVELKSHIIIDGRTKIGRNTTIYPFASIGQAPQDLKYHGEDSEVIIGENNIIREYVTIQRGTAGGNMSTIIGNNCLFMVGVHIAHDCIVGNNIILANYVSLAGHVKIGDFAIIGGLSAVQQYVEIGKHSMVGGVSAIVKNLIPFGLAIADRASLEGVNIVGMKRRGFEKDKILEASKAVTEIFASENDILSKRVELAKEKYLDNEIVQEIIEFLKQDLTKAVCSFKKNQ